MNKINNQIRREEFEKRRVYKGTLSKCQYGYDCPIFMNCLLEINQLKRQLEEKDKIINEAIEFIDNYKAYENVYKQVKPHQFVSGFEDILDEENINKLLEILERGKNANSK